MKVEVENLNTCRERVQILERCSLQVESGEVVALLGPNGAGKSTLLGTIAGIFQSPTGAVRVGDVNIMFLPAHRRIHYGIALVPENRQVFASLSTEENLALGAYHRYSRTKLGDDIDRMLDLFPALKKHRKKAAGWLSGGEQQMLAIGRALMAQPKALLLDEPSIGLAPRVADEVFSTLRRLKEEGLTILLVEQNVPRALSLADHVYLLSKGRIVFEGDPQKAGKVLSSGYLMAMTS